MIATMVKTLGERLKEAMDLRKAKIAAVAAGAGMSYQGVRKILRDETKGMDASTCAKLAAQLQINGEWLRTGEGEMVMGAAPEPMHERREITETEWQLLDDFGMLPEDDKQAIRASLHAKAENVRRIVDEFMVRRGLLSGTVSDAQVAAAYGTPPSSPIGSTGQYKKRNTLATTGPAGRGAVDKDKAEGGKS